MNSKPTLAEDFAAHVDQAEAQGEYGALGFFVSENAQAILSALRSHERMREALTEAAVMFEFYADQHQAKADVARGEEYCSRKEKAERNRKLGKMMRTALQERDNGNT